VSAQVVYSVASDGHGEFAGRQDGGRGAREWRRPAGVLHHARRSYVIDWSRLGFILANAPKFERNFELARMEQRDIDETWEQPWGERRFVRNHCREQRVTLREKTGERRTLVVVFRVFDDGVGFRYEFPEQPQLTQVGITEELTEFAVAEPATAWWIPGGEWNRYEYLYNKTPLAELGQAHTPVTIKTASGLHIAITKPRWSTMRACGCDACRGRDSRPCCRRRRAGPR
jgi:hypothetical protein